MSSARSNSVGLGLVTEGRELPTSELPAWTEDKVKVLPAVSPLPPRLFYKSTTASSCPLLTPLQLWKNPVTGGLHLQIHPSAVAALEIAPLATDAARTGDELYPEGATIEDLAEVRRIVYELQRPAVSPAFVYPHGQSHSLFSLRARPKIRC
jgi:hypothetical protein